MTKMQNDPPQAVSPNDDHVPDRQKALAQEKARLTFHQPTRQKHWRPAGHEEAEEAEAEEKRRRKMAKASTKANRRHANKKRKASRPKRHK
jgi:hypothetical protein